MATLQNGKCFTVPTFFGMCCRSEWQERMYIYKWHEVDQTKHEIFCVHIVCNEIQVKVNLEISTFFFYLRFPYCPNFFWFGAVHTCIYIYIHIYIYIYIYTHTHTYICIYVCVYLTSTPFFNINNTKMFFPILMYLLHFLLFVFIQWKTVGSKTTLDPIVFHKTI